MLSQNNLPKSVVIISFVELFVEIALYMMQSILILYLCASIDSGGMLWDKNKAIYLVGLFVCIMHFTPLLGGFLGGWLFTERACLLFGVVIISIGHLFLVFTFFGKYADLLIALFLIALGNGIFRTNIIALIGKIYDYQKNNFIKNKSKDEDDSFEDKRHIGFSLEFFAFNIGMFIGCIIGGYVANKYGYQKAFFGAFFSSILGLALFLVTYKDFDKTDFSAKKTSKDLNIIDDEIYSEILEDGKSGEIAIFKNSKNHNSKFYNKIILYSSTCFINFLYSFTLVVNYSLLNLYAENNMNRMIFGFNIPSTWHNAIRNLFMVILTPLILIVYHHFSKRKKQIYFKYKMVISLFCLGFAYLMISFYLKIIEQDQENIVISLWPLIAFNLLVAIHYSIYYPVIVSMATKLFSGRLTTTMIGFRSIITGFGAYFGGISGIITNKYSAYYLFISLGVFILIYGLFYFIICSFFSPIKELRKVF